MSRAFEDEFGVRDAFDTLPMAGRTDAWLVARAAEVHRLTCDRSRLQQFRARYLAHLSQEVHEPGPRKGVLPGVQPLVEALAGRDDVFLALLTGNFESGARIKLAYFDLWKYFRCGAFGDEALERNGLLDMALERANRCGLTPDRARVVIVGDTPLDVAVARAGGVRSVAVATGSYDARSLADCGADVVLENFSDLGRTIVALGI
jgi:phosphoglycolate phosphatase-like HAD superfamily hydrolase